MERSKLSGFAGFPDEARREAGYQLGFIQLGFEASDWKPMHSVGSGVREIRIYVEGAFRVFYLANDEEAIYVLTPSKRSHGKRPKKIWILKKNACANWSERENYEL